MEQIKWLFFFALGGLTAIQLIENCNVPPMLLVLGSLVLAGILQLYLWYKNRK